MFASHEVFNDITRVESGEMNIQDYLAKHNLTFIDIQNMYQINAIDQKQQAILNKEYQAYKDNIQKENY